ncbi:MAG: phospholipid carrier-dependent glycosyltransferase [Candidatus Lokiarchaeota archaeon]|nr:phospholipid carrier-dependent glycosyltransferase [Candidatus Lokiarchaeota archaeon]MBD3201325.1 phospholipid carrier-dependent glycosyltransferase [Candidatus Lokiarchaeota archaeon]
MRLINKITESEKLTIGCLLVFSFLLLLIGPVFFADYDIPDVKHYVALVDFFRAQGSFLDAGTAWRGRVIVPLLAAIIPVEASLSLRIVNIIFTLMCMIIFYKILSEFKFGKKQQILGTLLFIISVPTITIGSAPLTDSAGIFFIILPIYLYQILEDDYKKWLIISIVIGIGVFVRETGLFVIPVLIIWEIIKVGFNWKKIILSALFLGITPLITFIILRILVPRDLLSRNLDLSRLLENLTTETFEATTLATIGQLSIIILIGLVGNFSEIFNKSKFLWKLIFAAIVFFMQLAYAYLFESIGNRFFWIFFIFAIPFLLESFKHFTQDIEKS